MPDKLPELVSYAEAERLLDVKRSTVQRLIARGELEAVNVGVGDERPTIRIRVDSIERLLRRRQIVTAQ